MVKRRYQPPEQWISRKLRLPLRKLRRMMAAIGRKEGLRK